MDTNTTYLDLYDFRLQVAAMYRERREALVRGMDREETLQAFRAQRDHLFGEHPQSALDREQQRAFRGIDYYPYDGSLVVEARVEGDSEGEAITVATSGEESMPMRRVARLHFSLQGTSLSLALYWIEVYGGGLFLPFRDATAPEETYGGGRYLFDTVKGSDFEILPPSPPLQRIVLDFNDAYNPSCAYNPRWACPLAPRENRLAVPIRAGERKWVDATQRA